MSVAPITQTSIINVNIISNQIDAQRQKIISYTLRISTVVSYIGAVVASYLVNYNKNIKMAQDFYLYVTPSSEFFKIWPVIYSLLLVAVLHNVKNNIWKTKSSLIYIASNLIFILQSIIFSHRNVPGIVVGGLVLAVIDNILIYFWRVLGDEHSQKLQATSALQQLQQNITQDQIQNRSQIMTPTASNIQRHKYTQMGIFLVRNIISLYIGWVTVSGTVITGMAIVYWWGFSKCLQFVLFWITTPIAAIALYAFMAWKSENQPKYCYGYVLGVIYGMIGAGIASISKISQAGTC